MKLENLNALETLPLATSNQEVDERVQSIIDFHQNNNATPIHEVAEALVTALGCVAYSQHISIHVEPELLQWIDKNFNEDDDKYMDALATIYANMCTPLA